MSVLLIMQAVAPTTKEVMGLPFGWGAIFSIVGTIITTLLGGGVLGMWIKTRAENKKVDQDGDTQLRSEMWKDIEKLKTAKEENSRRLTIAETKLSEQATQLGQMRFLISLLNTEMDRVSPGNPIAAQVRVVMAELQVMASSSLAQETGEMAEIIARMSVVKGPSE